MVDSIDWQAAMSSEIFRNYVAQELEREAEEASEAAQIKRAEAHLKALEEQAEAFEEFERRVEASPVLKARLKQAQDALLNNPELAAKTDPDFVRGIMMLDLDEEK